MKTFPRWLITAVVLVMLVLLSGGVWFYNAHEQHLRQSAEKDLRAIADLKVGQIAAWRAERLGDAGVIMRSPFFIKGAVQWLANPQSVDTEQILTRFRSLRDNYHYHDVLLVDATGRVRLSLSGYSSRLHAAASQALATAFRIRRPVITNLHAGSSDPLPHIDVIAPLFAEKGKSRTLAGAVVLQSDARQFLYPMIKSWPTPRQSAETLIVRREGDMVLFLNELRHQPGTALNWRIPLSQKDLPSAMAILGKEGIVQGKDYRGEEVLAALKKVPDSPWFMVAKIDAAEAFAEWRLTSLLILALIWGLVAGVAVMAGMVWQRNAKAHYREMYQAEVKQREVEQRFRTTLMSVGDGVISTDADGRVEIMNPVAEDLTGWRQEEARDMPLEEVFKIINEDTRQPVENPVRRVVREGMVVGLANHTVLIAKDGTERSIADSGAPVHDEQGNIIGVVLVFRDQTAERAAQKALQDSHQHFVNLADSGQALIWTSGPDKKCDYFNLPWLKFTGRTLEQELGNGWAEGVHPDDLTRCIEIYTSAFDRRERFSMIYRLRRHDGEYRWIQDDGAPRYDSQGNFIGYIGHCLDITDRNLAEEALKASHTRQKVAMDLAKLVQWEYDVEKDLFTFDDQFYALYGTTADQQGKTLMSAQEYASKFIPPEEVNVVQEATAKALATTDPNYSQQMEHRIIRADGQERIIMVRFAIIKDEAGRTIKTYGANQDITERKLAGETLRESEIRYRRLFEAARDGILILDAETGVIVDVNPYLVDILGISREQLLDKKIWELGFFKDIAANQAKFEELRVKHYVRYEDLPLETIDGRQIDVEFVSNIYEVQGRKVIQCNIRDVSERKQAAEEKARLEDQLRRVQKLEAIGTLAGGIAHDFNNILSAQLGYTQLALEDVRGNQRVEESLRKALQASKRARDLVKQILSFSRQAHQEFRPMRVYLVAREALELLRASIPTTIEITQDLQGSAEAIMGDAGQIHQVVMNICTNAAHAMREKGGVLEVKLDSVCLDEDALVGLEGIKPGRYQRLTVKDTGHGMDRETLDRIFDPFFTTKGQGEGTGLGLSMVYGIVRDHGGTIRAYSEPGKGTMFHVYLPLFEEEGEAQEDIHAKSPLPTGNEHILLLDDEEMLVDVEDQMLKRLGYKITGFLE